MNFFNLLRAYYHGETSFNLRFPVPGTDKVTRYRNCKVLRGNKLELGDIWVRGGVVIDPMKLFYEEKKLPDVVVECNELIASPGFIDLQVNGECYYFQGLI